jgi:Flp pilus assembly protein TadG
MNGDFNHIPRLSHFQMAAQRARLLRGDRGSALVEYALVFILLMTMLLGVAEFGRALYAYHFVSSAAREGARYAMVRGCTPTTTSCPTAADATSVQDFVKNVPLGIDASKLSVATTWTPNHKAGSTVSVTTTYTFNFVFPWVSNATLTMTSTSKMVISQ